MVFASTLTWYYTNWQTPTDYTGTNRLTQTHKNILTPPITCTQQLPVLH